MSRFKGLTLMAGLGAALALAACRPDIAQSPPSQVVASVGSKEISILQFNHALKAVGIARPGEPIRREITEKLIDRELAVQQALAEKLDRTPEVLLQLEEARRDVLARAYAEKVAGAARSPSDTEIARYYSDHPALFGERQVFRLREMALPADMPQLAEVKVRLAQKQTLAQVSAWLREQNAEFNEQAVIRAAEQLPIEALPRLSKAGENQTVLFESPRGVIAYTVLATQAAPVSWERARPIIRDYLARNAGKSAMERRVAQLRTETKISYGDAFAPPSAARASLAALAPAR